MAGYQQGPKFSVSGGATGRPPHLLLLHIIAPPALPDTNFDVEEDQRASCLWCCEVQKRFFMLFLFFMCVLHVWQCHLNFAISSSHVWFLVGTFFFLNLCYFIIIPCLIFGWNFFIDNFFCMYILESKDWVCNPFCEWVDWTRFLTKVLNKNQMVIKNKRLSGLLAWLVLLCIAKNMSWTYIYMSCICIFPLQQSSQKLRILLVLSKNGKRKKWHEAKLKHKSF